MNEKQKVHHILKEHHHLNFSHSSLIEFPGILIVLEGNDGAGKTTQSKKLVDMINILPNINKKTHYVRTPGGTELGEELREILLHSSYDICPVTEAFLFAAQLAQCITQVIYPCLKVGDIVICDRLIFSPLAYQAAGREQNMKDIWDLQLRALQGIWPDFGFMLRNHIKKESSGDRMEEAGKQFSERVKAYYDLILSTNGSAAELMTAITVFPDANDTAEFLYNIIVHKIKHSI